MKTIMESKLRTILNVGECYTVYRMSSFGIIFKIEIKIVNFFDGNPVYKLRGRLRKKYVMKLEFYEYCGSVLKVFDGAVFCGWDQPIKCDSEQFNHMSKMFGNGCFSFLGSVDEIRHWIDNYQINPDFSKDLVISRLAYLPDHPGIVVYPELYKGGNSVIDSLLSAENIH